MARTLCPHLRGVLVAALAAALAVPGTSIAQASGPGSGETASFSSGRPGPDLFSEKYVQDAVRRCRGMDLLLRDTVSGHGLSIGPADGPGRLVPLPSNEPGRYALECSDGYLVELEGSAPTEPTASITSIVPGAELVQQFDTLFDGIHVRLSPGEAEELRARGFTVWENAEVRATVRESVPLINADAVWSRGSPVQGAPWVTGQTGRGSTIAIVDTGIDYRHPDLGNGCFELPPRVLKESPCKVVGGYDVVNGDPDPVDDHGHGTHVAAIAAGNGVLKGVAPDAKLYAFKVLNAGGWGTFDQVIEGLERAVDPNGDGRLSDAADVINLSLGGYGNPDDPLSRAVDNAVGAGSVVAVAAGNGSYGVSDEEKISSPGTSLTAITVGATTKADEMTSFSSRGPVLWNGRAIVKPDLVAPGQEICAARHGTAWSTRTCLDQVHVSLSGTSMAAPHVAGVIALLEEARPGLAPEQIKSVLKGSAVPLSINQSVVAQGAGRVDALQAVAANEAPPVALLDPVTLTGTTRSISGSVGGNLREWHLAYAPFRSSAGPEGGWIDLVRSGTAPAGNALHDLTTRGIPDGRYILRLAVTDVHGRRAVDYGFVEVDKVQLVRPAEHDVVRGGDVVDVDVKTDPSLSDAEFTLEHGAGYNPSSWTPAARGRNPHLKWDTRGLAAGPHTLRLTVTHDGIVDQEQIMVILDPRLAPGWPVRVPVENNCGAFTGPCASVTGWADPVAEDLDGDGATEILFLRSAPIPELRAYRADGTLAWSTPVGQTALAPESPALFSLHLPVVADIDGDGGKDILVFNTADSTLYVFSGTGEPRADWPVPLGSGAIPYLPRMALADVNADGTHEVVLSLMVFKEYGGTRPTIVVISTDGGAKLAEWPVTKESPRSIHFYGADYNYAPAIGNLDGDPALEIVAVESIGSTIRAFDWDGTELGSPDADPSDPIDGVGEALDAPGWPVEGGSGQEYFPVTIGDLDDDGDNEVIAGLRGGSALTRLWVLDGQGRPLPGWPATLTNRISTGGASLGDLDGDGDLELVVPMSGQVAAYHHDGRFVSGWPVPTRADAAYPAAVGNIDASAGAEVVIHGTGPFLGSLQAWSANGRVLSGFGMPVEAGAKAPLLLTEVDGRVAVVATSDSDHVRDRRGQRVSKERLSLHLWQLPQAYDPATMPWPTYQHDVSRRGSAD